ncbi:Glyoxylase, beta-lactamase superfamily II [Paenibacillus sophorae]|uniref:Glyoxylase, beta-lactamase superfamily II n=1 Tax=Paenibacillus sophorae TaxID=1333845 RepID=A0A1H8Q3T5_9BACL|nr:MBL fold metallo-hydrolase [Paenibacillus sophorae]QWU15288.1 MBL fold metallo-hydrolase [Paenibacillus sophorae]SEO48716.1 Glyoxylase, beta-lactamase superfamily II [Paenibacillus sophorae]
MTHHYQQISPHVFIMHAEHETDRPILAAIAGERRTLLMDAGNSPAHAELFRRELKRRGVRMPEILALTHWHWDHTFGMQVWNLPVVAHAETSRALTSLSGLDWSDGCLLDLIRQGTINEESAADIWKEFGGNRDIRIVEPDILFQGRISFDLGGVVCEMIHVGGDHSADSCILHVREDRVLFLGDALGPSVYGGPRKYTSAAFLQLLSVAYGYNAQWYVESHGVPMSGEEFRSDLAGWEKLARIVEAFGHDRERVVHEMKAFLQCDELPKDLLQGLDYFMAGRANMV